jgi:hypothetical protein
MLLTSNTKVLVDGTPALLESDIHSVIGCPFAIGPRYSPCLRIEWSSAAVKVQAGRVSVLIKTSIGKCINAEGAPQGVATIVKTQMKADAK